MIPSANENNLFDSRPTFVEVDLDALTHNFRLIQKHAAPAKIMPIVKSNAYGHGIIEVSQHLESLGADALGVALVEEGVQLRRAGVKIPILVLGGVLGSQVSLFLKNNLDITASSVFKLEFIEREAKAQGIRARVHLKIDTGLERIGVHWYSAEKLVDAVSSCKHCDIEGVFSHFAAQDSDDITLVRLQLERFHEVLELFSKKGLPIPQRHIAASGALIQLRESHLDMVRPGAAIYGVVSQAAFKQILPLKPVLSLHSRVVFFKVAKKGSGVSYGHTWKAPCDTRIVTIPIGYGDGYPRRLSNIGHVLIRGKRYPVVGRVGMDQMMVDIGPDGEAYNGDEVTLIGQQDTELVSVEQVSEIADLDIREFLVSLNSRIPRHFLKK